MIRIFFVRACTTNSGDQLSLVKSKQMENWFKVAQSIRILLFWSREFVCFDPLRSPEVPMVQRCRAIEIVWTITGGVFDPDKFSPFRVCFNTSVSFWWVTPDLRNIFIGEQEALQGQEAPCKPCRLPTFLFFRLWYKVFFICNFQQSINVRVLRVANKK